MLAKRRINPHTYQPQLNQKSISFKQSCSSSLKSQVKSKSRLDLIFFLQEKVKNQVKFRLDLKNLKKVKSSFDLTFWSKDLKKSDLRNNSAFKYYP
ncbi:hypothetical protein BpHYR1_041878 [Brachionus plicatilis]|uniref:Uncharacterized protein n=1 Tax=Brachionus plicatilis TaxID=10195 RepID=A0A3M7PJ21_BRAPC|nr:hypothetical protein BpHYR1_041878 [Brachionus plicatilis]